MPVALRSLRDIIAYLAVVIVVLLLSSSLGLNTSQILGIGVFTMLITGALLFWRQRLAFAFGGLSLMMIFGLVNVENVIEFAGLDIILFLIGMMVVVGYLEEKRFFEFIINRVTVFSRGNAQKLLVLLMLMSALFSALVSEVTAILFMASAVLHLSGRYKISPIPFIIMVVFASNIGSAATVIGNPVGVIIALRGDLTFLDFLRWASPISVAALLMSIPLLFFYFRQPMKELGEKMRSIPLELEDAPDASTLRLPALLFFGTVFALIGHHQIELLFGLERNSMLLGVALAAAGITLFIERERARELIEKRVEWWSLSFFLLLFASVGALEVVGVTTVIAEGLLAATGGNPLLTFITFTWVTGSLSAVLDNVLAVAMFAPVVEELGKAGLNNFPLWWGMLFAGTFFGNLTLIGSTANIVAIGMLESRRGGHITLRQWIKPGALVSIPTLLLATILILVQIPL